MQFLMRMDSLQDASRLEAASTVEESEESEER
jgi:hypothetical protein